MEAPQTLSAVPPRRREEAAAMAVAVQANLVALKVAWSRRAQQPTDDHPIRVPAPGGVTLFRETLIDRQALHDYSDEELVLRTRQVWGEFSLLCWAFHNDDPNEPPDFAALPAAVPMRCPGALITKSEEITRILWRLRHEQRLRFDPAARSQPSFQRDHERAMTLPVRVYEVDIRLCTNADLVQCACEHAGMLGAVRWLIDARKVWGEAGIMSLELP